ncbi:unnamed protein product [Tuber melanosporum]|uniref:(Perigord truffle) hypothetical protein n=1 Tax=Tuber melanosporum (strain Mel28) TaxID=656061 RepID=D5G9R6_TUBMM|nr:uncharacterized protein GSTUM_00005040001 [Tuber melanosporum]CAZ81259.1 unnamed protein product [Tuber melanosporum]
MRFLEYRYRQSRTFRSAQLDWWGATKRYTRPGKKYPKTRVVSSYGRSDPHGILAIEWGTVPLECELRQAGRSVVSRSDVYFLQADRSYYDRLTRLAAPGGLP